MFFKIALLPVAMLSVFRADDYLGSKVCAGCHQSIYQSYTKTAMGNSMSAPPFDAPEARLEKPSTNRAFSVSRETDGVYQSESGEQFRVKYRLEFAIGSGVNGRTFLIRKGDYLFEAPLSWYSRTGKWDFSPGYEFVDYGFHRPITAGCIQCHSGRPEPVEDREGMYRNPPFPELAIGCENCHGPGGKHARSGDPRQIVNPAKLPARLAEQICMNCHQSGDTRVLQPGKSYADFRPGYWLDDTLAIFKLPAPESRDDLLEHHSSMEASRCFVTSGGKLSCLSCHDPHVSPSVRDRANYYRARCAACHSDCPLPLKARGANDCTGCHMPKRNVPVISHSTLTDHRIPRRQDVSAAAHQLEGEGELIHVNRRPDAPGHTVPALTLLHAYGELMGRDSHFVQPYLTLLKRLGDEQPNNPMVQAALGSYALRSGSGNAIAHLSRAIDLGYSAGPAFEDLAEALSRAKRLDEAVATLQRGIALEPYRPTLYKSLILRYIQLQCYIAAKSTMERYLGLFPEDSFMRELMKKTEQPK